MTESPEELAAVEQLLGERDALHGWLTRLEQAGAAAPDTVRDRVRRDYQQRLDQLTGGLRAHADLIASKLRDDRREHDDLFGRATAAREALAEAELRHAVGEFDHQRYDAERTRHGSDIETYEVSLAAVAERIARLEDVHALVERAPRASGDLADTTPGIDDFATQPEPEPEPEPQTHVINDVDEELIAIADLGPDADPEDVLAIFDDGASEARRAAAAGASPAPVDTTGPLSFRPSGTVTNGAARSGVAPPANAAPLGLPSASVPPRFVRPGERIRNATTTPAPPATRVPPAVESPSDAPSELFSEDIVASGPRTESAAIPVGRTLRCSECGAMNRPLEWYCEKCGAELSAV